MVTTHRDEASSVALVHGSRQLTAAEPAASLSRLPRTLARRLQNQQRILPEVAVQITPAITFRGLARSPAVQAEIHERLGRLEGFYPGIIGCRVLVELVQHHHQSGNHYHVRIDLTVPGEEIVVAHEANLRAAAQDVDAEKIARTDEPDPARRHVRVAIRNAFDIARRQLQDYARQQRGVVKTAVKRPRGRISRLFPVKEYGYIEAEDGHEVYFQKSSVLKGAFALLAVGTAVSFAEEAGERGPQASSVRLLHPHRVHRAAQTAHATPGRRIVR